MKTIHSRPKVLLLTAGVLLILMPRGSIAIEAMQLNIHYKFYSSQVADEIIHTKWKVSRDSPYWMSTEFLVSISDLKETKVIESSAIQSFRDNSGKRENILPPERNIVRNGVGEPVGEVVSTQARLIKANSYHIDYYQNFRRQFPNYRKAQFYGNIDPRIKNYGVKISTPEGLEILSDIRGGTMNIIRKNDGIIEYEIQFAPYCYAENGNCAYSISMERNYSEALLRYYDEVTSKQLGYQDWAPAGVVDIESAYAEVSKLKIRRVSPFDGDKYIPISVDEALANGATCREMSVGLHFLLKKLGVPSKLVLMDIEDRLGVADIPIIEHMNHMLVYLPNQRIFIDPAYLNSKIGAVQPNAENKIGLILPESQDEVYQKIEVHSTE